MDKTSLIFQKNLKRLRKAANLTQAELAEAIDMSVRGYQKYEQGESSPGPAKAQAIAQVLGCTVADLYAEPQPTPNPNPDQPITDQLREIVEFMMEQRERDKNRSEFEKAQLKVLEELRAENERLKALIGPHKALLKRLQDALPIEIEAIYRALKVPREDAQAKKKGEAG